MARKKMDTMTEQMFYVLLALRGERHGYAVMQYILELTEGRVTVGAGTLYALLDRFERDGLIRQTRIEEKRKYYRLTGEGDRALRDECRRIMQQAADMERVLREEGRPGERRSAASCFGSTRLTTAPRRPGSTSRRPMAGNWKGSGRAPSPSSTLRGGGICSTPWRWTRRAGRVSGRRHTSS